MSRIRTSLVVRQVPGYPFLYLLRAYYPARALDIGSSHLAVDGMGYADERRRYHPGMPGDDLLNLARMDVFASPDVHLLAPVRHVQVAVGVHEGQVAGMQPALRVQYIRSFPGMVEVAMEDRLPAHGDLLDLSRGSSRRSSPTTRTSTPGRGSPMVLSLCSSLSSRSVVVTLPMVASVSPHPTTMSAPILSLTSLSISSG